MHPAVLGYHWEKDMSVKYTVSNIVHGTDATVIFEGEATTPEEALASVTVLTGTASVGSSAEEPTKVPGKFTKGDRVVFNCDYEPDGVTKGDTGTVERAYVRYGDSFVEVKLDKGGTANCWVSRVDHLTEQQPELRIGARIRITDAAGSRTFKAGDTGVIVAFWEPYEPTGGPRAAEVRFDHDGKVHSCGAYSTYEVIG